MFRALTAVWMAQTGMAWMLSSVHTAPAGQGALWHKLRCSEMADDRRGEMGCD